MAFRKSRQSLKTSRDVRNSRRDSSKGPSPRSSSDWQFCADGILPVDLQVNILSFLSEQDIRRVSQLNRHFQSLLSSHKTPQEEGPGHYLWKSLAQQRWPFLSLASECAEREPSSDSDPKAMRCSIDQSLRSASKATPWKDIELSSECSTVNLDDTLTNRTVIRFEGQIGREARCVRASPLPRSEADHKKTGRPKLWQRLRFPRRGVVRQEIAWKPFVLPFQLRDGLFSLEPRSISYFEVNILEATATTSSPFSLSSRRDHDQLWTTTLSSECVAVGISLEPFAWQSRMPGWDDISFGYHSDDGYIHHNKTKKFASRFGVNDTVGCGIDYKTKSIFYTLNGSFLGYMCTLDDKQLKEEWFPTVGMDSQNLVEFNFGTHRPFVYDLGSMVEMDRIWSSTRSVRPTETLKM